MGRISGKDGMKEERRVGKEVLNGAENESTK